MTAYISAQELNSADWIRRRIERLEGKRQAALREAARIEEEINDLSVDLVIAIAKFGPPDTGGRVRTYADNVHGTFKRRPSAI